MARERRDHIRVEWQSRATIQGSNDKRNRRCIVKDLSDGGAKIAGIAAIDVPDDFVLRFGRGPAGLRRCKVVWRSADALGVEFSDEQTSPPKSGLTKATRGPALSA